MLRFLRPKRQWFSTSAIPILIFICVYLYTSSQQVDKVNYSVNNVLRLDFETQPIVDNAKDLAVADLTNKATWLALQEKRKAAIKEQCKDIPKEVLLKTILKYKASRNTLLVDDNHKAIYCTIPKVASMNWKKTWMIMSGMENIDKVSSMTRKQVNEAFEGKSLKYTLDVETLKYKLRNYTKMIVVRHPLERLLSVYEDEINVTRNLAPIVLRTVKKTRPEAKLTDITWPEFVDFIVREGVIDSFYWITFEDLCHPCAIDYDVIAKFETFKVDSDHFLDSINASVQIPEPTTDNSRVDSTLLASRLKELTDTQIMALRRKYHRDYLLFQYK